MKSPKTAHVVRMLTADLLRRIRRHEWVTQRKRADAKCQHRTRYRLDSSQSWGDVLKVMR